MDRCLGMERQRRSLCDTTSNADRPSLSLSYVLVSSVREPVKDFVGHHAERADNRIVAVVIHGEAVHDQTLRGDLDAEVCALFLVAEVVGCVVVVGVVVYLDTFQFSMTSLP